MSITPFTQRQGWAPVRQRSTAATVAEIIGIGVGLWGLATMLNIVSSEGGVGATAFAGILAFIPLLVVLGAVRWIDRWEPEPRATLIFAFVWGAGVATLVSLFFNSILAEILGLTGINSTAQLAVSVAVGAPFVEELTKGLGVLLIYLVQRSRFDGPVDGVVYGAVVAAGFAFVENILYFVQYADEIGGVFFGRAIMSPFAHVIFTAMTGLMLGVAARSRSRHAWVGYFPLGLALAMLLHALWNFSTLSTRYLTLYLVLQLPLFIAMIALVYWLRRMERDVLRHRLGEYARAGWFSPNEVHMLTDFRERRRARAWASQQGRKAPMVAFQKAATDLAFQRERHVTGRVPANSDADQQHLLALVTQARAEIFA